MSVYLSIRRYVRYRPSVRHNYYYAEHLSLLGDAYGDVTLLYTYGEAIFSRVPDDVITESNAADVKHQNLKLLNLIQVQGLKQNTPFIQIHSRATTEIIMMYYV